MKLIAAYLLATLGGKASPTSADVKKILSSVGIEADDERLDKLVADLKGKNINEVIAAGAAKMSALPAGGGGGAAPAAAAAAPAASAAAPAAAAKKEEKKVEKEEESDDDMGFGLFD
ncbi:hypothetical protein DFJ73DRAFT_658270 [Zopfochytrium polystomum]|nr:hypothetical protein DFJ73DRAFT_658270 [Zopfochytrium polystomum]